MNITDHIEASGRTRGQICELAGISRAMLSMIENGDRKISPSRAQALAEALGITAADLRPDLAALFPQTAAE